MKAGRKKWVQSELFALAVTLALVTAARSSLADHYWVPTGSMEHSLMPGDRVIVDKTEASLNLADGGGPDIPPTIVPDGMLLMLGDHRGDSLDGRFFGFIDERELYGRAVAIFYRSGEGFGWKEL